MLKVLVRWVCLYAGLWSPPLLAQGVADAGVVDEGASAPAEASEPQFETVVSARRAYTAASAATIRDEDFATRPITDASDLLEVTPGLFTVQHAGGGKANQYFLRGFDIDHGTDLALSVDGVPVNMVSHGHGQGYADLHFVIPETIASLEVTKGPYDPRFGDFATAGAVNLVTRRAFAASLAELTYGSFDTWRGLVIAAPQFEGPLQGFAAAELFASNGPFVTPERMRRFNLLARASYRPSSRTDVALQLGGYGSGWNASGQIPLRAVEAGTLGRFESVDPTEGGSSQRHSALLSLEHRDPTGGEVALRAYLVRYRLELFSNFTFFAEDPVQGDQLQQSDLRTVSGFEARYVRPIAVGPVRVDTTAGVRLRGDVIDNGLAHSVGRERLARRVDAHVEEGSFGAFLQGEVAWTRWLHSQVGIRADYFGFQVEDRLENFSASGDRTSGHAQALRFSPKASVVLTPSPLVDVYLNFGRGFHSNDARGIVRGTDPVDPLAAATGYELGLRARLPRALDLAVAAWALDLDSEIVWVGDEGTTEARPATRRRGLEAELRYRITSWLRADADLTWTHARFVQETGGGRLVPLAPTLTWSGGLQARHPVGVSGSLRIQGLADRPANEDGSLVAEGFTLVDLEVGHEWRNLRLTAAARNLLNVPWRQAQFANSSRLPGEAAPVEDLHFTPGYPLSLSLSLAVRL